MEHVYKHATSSRAKAVLKDLMEVLKENGFDYDTPTVKHTVAGLYGYGSWSAMMQEVGTHAANGPEDYQLSEKNSAARRECQLKALCASGLTVGFAEYLLDRLKPTSRAVGRTSTTDGLRHLEGSSSQYHPLRLLNCYRQFDERFIQQGKPTGELYDIVKAYRGWLNAQDQPHLNALDLKKVSFEELTSSLQMRSPHDLRYLIDATGCCPPEYSFRDMASNAPHYSRGHVHYIHFGKNAFPSPFSDAGIEGAYIRLKYNYEPEQVLSNAVQLLFVCSDSLGHDLTASPESSLMSLLRGYFFSYNAETNGKLHPLWAHEKSSSRPDHDPNRDPWPGFIKAPLYSAMSALKAFHDRSVSISDHICGDMPLSARRAISRAVSEYQIYEAVQYLDENGVLVRVLGGARDNATIDLSVSAG